MPADEYKKPSPDDVIETLYEVAVDPSRYEALLDRWEAMIAPHRQEMGPERDSRIGLDHLIGHVERADQVLDRVLKDDGPRGPEAVLQKIGRSASFAVSRTGKIIAVNASARSLLQVEAGLPISSLDLGEGDADQLAHMITRLLNANVDETMVLRARTLQSDRLILFHVRVIRSDDEPPYALVISSNMQWPEGFDDMLRAAFELTPAESDVVRTLTEGHTLQQIADNRGRSIDTIRAQLKSIMAKTETRSQTELVRLVLSTMEIASYSEAASAEVRAVSEGYETLAPRPFHTLELKDGRQMDYLLLGASSGQPVLYLPLDYGLVRWPADAEARAAALGIRIIVPVRAGYGASSPLPKRSPYIPQIVDDVEALLNHLNVGRLPVLSLGSDFHIAAALGQQHPDRFSGIIACAGVLPITRPEQYDRMDKWHRFILAGARYTPHLLPFMVKAGFALAKRLGKQGFLNAVYGKSAADVATFSDPAVLEALTVGSEVCLSDSHSAHDAFAREVIAHETTDWTESVLALKDRIPVTLMNGLQDPQVPPETLAEFKRDYPWISFKVYPDAGQLIFFLKWPDVLDELQVFLTRT